jgi:hypothetical protein
MTRRLLFIAAAILAMAIVAPVAFSDDGGGKAIYDATVSPLPGNLPSVGAEAYSFNEFGDEVTFADKARLLRGVTVTLSSWGCETGHWYDDTCATSKNATFSIPMTLNIYNAPSVGYGTGSLIASKTQTFTVPLRPSDDDVKCPPTDGSGRWYDRSSKTCFHGLATNVTFDFKGQNVVLPDTVVYGITYNTTSSGPSPIGPAAPCFTSSAGCPYDSLNIALGPQVNVGSKPNPDTVYQNSPYGFEYCDNGAAGVGTFRLDSPSSACWGGFVPAVQFTAIKKG